MSEAPPCSKCKSQYTYADGENWVCPECAHEWPQKAPAPEASAATAPQEQVVKDANGNVLNSGDAVTVLKELKIKGASSVVKAGTKVRNIRIIDNEDGHNIACKIEGIGSINLKSEFVKKA